MEERGQLVIYSCSGASTAEFRLFLVPINNSTRTGEGSSLSPSSPPPQISPPPTPSPANVLLFCCRAEICTSVLHKAKSSLNLADKAVLQICEAFRLDRAFRDNPGITFYLKGLYQEMADILKGCRCCREGEMRKNILYFSR
jgi:hypothetical protein